MEASHNAAADLALKALADSGVKIGSQPKQAATDGGGKSATSGPRTLVSVNAKKKQKAAAAAAAAASAVVAAPAAATPIAAAENSAPKSVSNGRDVVVDDKAKDDLRS